MRSFTIKNIFTLMLLTAMLVVGGSGVVKGQSTKIYTRYLTSDKIAGAKGPGNLLGTDGNPGTADIFNTGYLDDLIYSNYTEIKLTSGTHGVGLLSADGGASTGSITMNVISPSSFPTGTPLIIKLTSTDITNVDIRGYFNTTPLGGGATLFSSLGKVSTDEYIFITPATCNRIMISTKTNVGTSASSAFTNNTNIYYLFYIPAPVLSSTPSTICSGSQATLSVNSPNNNLVYKWYNSSTSTEVINTGNTFSPYLTNTTTYYVEAVEDGIYSSARTPVTVTVNSLPSLTTTTPSKTIATGSTTTLSVVATGSTVEWYDDSGVKVNSTSTYTPPAFSSAGTHNYNVIATNSTTGCTNSTTISLTVYEPSGCTSLTERVYANSQIITNNVTTPSQAADGNPKTSSTLTPVLDLLGLFSPTQTLFWSSEVTAGTPAIVKLGPGIGVLSLISGISIVGVQGNSSSYTEIGTPQSVNVSLLNLLSGENTFEYTFVPSNSTGPKKYNGIKIIFTSVLSLGTTLNVFDAYFTRPATTIADCTKKDIIDVLSGAVAPAGVSAITTAVNVQNPWLAVDGDESTYATINNTVSVLAYAKETIVFSSPSMPGVSVGDSLKLIVSKGGALLGVDLLTQFKIQRYLGNSPVGDLLENGSTFLNISLLTGNTKAAIIIKPTPEPYDRVEIQVGGVATVLGSLNLHEVQRTATVKVIGGDPNNKITVCQGTNVLLTAPSNTCTTYLWYDSPVGGTQIATINNLGLAINTSTQTQPKVYYIQPVRFGCENLARTAITIITNPLPPHPITNISSN